MSFLDKWLTRKWFRDDDPKHIQLEDEAYSLALARLFSGSDGQIVLKRWLDHDYCTVATLENNARFLEGRRSFVHDVLVVLDAHEHPEKRMKDDG